MIARWAFVGALTALAGCGRLGFDATGAQGDGSGSAGTPIALELPAGGAIVHLALSPAAGPWYAITTDGAAYRSDDHQSWVPCGALVVTTIAARDSTTVYAGGTDVSVSTDACATWQPLPTGRFADGVGLSFNTVYALLDNGLRKLNGTTWSTITTPLDGAAFKELAAAAGSPYLIGTNAGLLHSADAVTWTSVAGLPSGQIADVATSPAHTYAISAASGMSNGVVSCSDGTATTWTTCYGVGGTSVAVDLTNPAHAFAAVYDNLVETTDGFATSMAERRGGAMGYEVVHEIRFEPDGSVVAAGDRGVFYAAAGTIAWQPRYDGLNAWTVRGFARAGSDIYIATDGGVLHAVVGEPYTHSFAGMGDNTQNNAIAVAPNGMVLSVGRDIWGSTDHGVTWATLVQLGVADSYRAYSLLLDGGRAYVGTAASVFIADPPYTSWTAHAVNHTVFALLHTGTRLWAGTDMGLYTSDDDGASFQPVAAVSVECDSLAQLADGSIVVGTQTGTLISDASRTTWTPHGPTNRIVRHLLVSGDALVASGDAGVFASHDGGTTWAASAMTSRANAALLDAADGQLVVGTNGHGIVKTAIP